MISDNFTIIHIGKCGGSTVTSELKNHNIKFDIVHCRKVNYDSNKKYIIIIRNPIKRFISAFNWRYKLVCDTKEQEARFKGEKQILNKYKNVQNLIKDLEKNKDLLDENYIHHIREDINYYLGEFLKKCKNDQILGVICTETLNDDLKMFFNIDVTKKDKDNSNYQPTILLDSEYNVLKNYLQKDYKCIERLFNMGCITNDKYKFLSM